MTLLTKTIRRELPHQFDRRNWITEFHPWGIRFRAMLIEVERRRAEKKAARKKAA